MNTNKHELFLKDEVHMVVGCAFEVLNALGHGLLEKPDTMPQHKSVAKRGGKVAGNARKETEKELGHSIISGENYLPKDDLPGLIEEDKTE